MGGSVDRFATPARPAPHRHRTLRMMPRPAILAFAAICGLVAFGWSLVARRPPPLPPAHGVRMGGVMFADRPRDLSGLAQWLESNPEDFDGWSRLAELRRYAGDPAG